LQHDRPQLGQVNRCDFPKLVVIEAPVLVPQDIADPDDRGPSRIGVLGEGNPTATLSQLPKRSARRVPPPGDARNWLCIA
jgi:hypothetical protein